MRKFLRINLFVIIMTILTISIVGVKVNADETTNAIHVHYYRYDGNYTPWDVWMWQKAPKDQAGAGYAFSTTVDEDYGGRVAVIPLTGTLAGSTQVGIIIRTSAWLKDVSTDRVVNVPEQTTDGILHIYMVEGDERIGMSKTDPNGPDKTNKFKTGYFSDEKTIKFTTTYTLLAADVSLYVDGVLTNSTVTVNKQTGTIKLANSVDLTKKYVIKAIFGEEGQKEINVTFDGIYDSNAFKDAYTYTGNDLGAIVHNGKTTFRLWAPISDSITLNIYNTGTPLKNGGSDTVERSVLLTKDIRGTWYYEENNNLHGKYYTYTVKNGNTETEVVDPYAKSTGVNGLRGMIVDFSLTNPTGWIYEKRANNITNYTDAIIYELHVRDLTSHSSWNGTEKNRGKFLGLSESGTTYKDVTTGFDHIKELGITHLQILPFFDHGSVDETRLDDPTYKNKTDGIFNWGYMPQNFNTLEGSYSSNPYDGLVRINEFKQMVMAYTDANIRINMDVVYNHTGQSADSSLNIILPGYYYRMNSDGSFSNGSGCGNETASERSMVRKFMVDSVLFWATEYNISGFRFDLMGLHDTETMNLITTELHKIDPTIMVYGEPWTGGDSLVNASKAADKTNLTQMDGVAVFNDDLRDALKGSVFSTSEKGLVQGDKSADKIARARYGIAGGTLIEGINASSLSYNKDWCDSPCKLINYVACHDNNTLYDKLMQSLSFNDKKYVDDISKQTNLIVLTSQGICFIHAGDEFLRTKPKFGATGYESNSYNSPDSTNQIKWGLKVDNLDVNNYYKGLIALRKAHPAFRMTNEEDIKKNLQFLYQDNSQLLAYEISNAANNDSYSKILVLNNLGSTLVKVTLPTGGDWQVVVDSETAGTSVIKTVAGGSTYFLLEHQSAILLQGEIKEEEPEPEKKKGCKKSSAEVVIATLSALSLSALFLKKKQH